MTVLVVDPLQMVDVDQGDGQWLVEPAGVCLLVGGTQPHHRPGQRSGERLSVRTSGTYEVQQAQPAVHPDRQRTDRHGAP